MEASRISICDSDVQDKETADRNCRVTKRSD
jgi:hypothetical protein